MLLKRKESVKVKTKGCEKGYYHQEFNHELEPNLHLVTSCIHVGSYEMNTLNYNYKLRSVFGLEDDFATSMWRWFDTQVCNTCLWSWMISWSLVDYTDMGRIVGCILDDV